MNRQVGGFKRNILQTNGPFAAEEDPFFWPCVFWYS